MTLGVVAGCGQAGPDLSDMVEIPAGEFVMGRDDGAPDERPAHRVWLDRFYIDRTEVTNAEFAAFCKATDRIPPNNPMWDQEYFTSKPDHPVVNLTWEQARAYCEWAGKQLPTEAQWEKAARGTDGRLYPWGNTYDASRANLYGDADPYRRTAPVGSFPAGASPYGVLDMVGNVWEWCADWFAADYYAKAPARNPAGPDSSTGFRALRGGSYSSPQGDAVVTNRSQNPPQRPIQHLGCRCAWTPGR